MVNVLQTKKRLSLLTTSSDLVAEAGLEPHDLRVMSPASYQLLHSAILIAALKSGINGARDRT